MKNKTLLFFGLSMFFTGAAGLVNEYVLSTVSTYILGNSIEQFSITIALMLGFMGLGGFVQKFITDKNLISKFLILEFSLAIFGGFAPLAMYGAFAYMEDHFVLIQYFFIGIIGFLVGFEIPFIIRINEKHSKSLKTNLSIVMSADYIGSLVGAFVWVYLLLPYIPLTKISFIISGINLLVAIITVLYLEKSLKTVISSLIMVSILILGYVYSDKCSVAFEQKLYEDKVVVSETTKYQHLVITENKKLNEYRLYINGNTQFSSLDEGIYHDNIVHPIMSLNPTAKNILVIGGGDGMVVRELKKYKGINISLIDLDHDMIELAKNNKILKKLNKGSFNNVEFIKPSFVTEGDKKDIFIKKEYVSTVSVINIDADKMLFSLIKKHKKWDIIIIDLPDPSTVELTKLYSKEFYIKVRKLLSKGGMFIVQSTSPYHAKEAFLCIGRTIEAAKLNTLPFHDNVPSFGDWGWWIAWNPSDYSKEEIFSKIDNLKFRVNTDYLTENKFRANLIFGKKWLKSKYKDINTLMFPKLLNIYTNDAWLNY